MDSDRSPEREQAEALQMIDALRLELPGEVWGDVKRIVLALVERAEKAERERDDARINAIQQAHDASAAMWREQKNRADAAVERERELTRALERIARMQYRDGNFTVTAGTFDGALQVAREALAGGVSAAGRKPAHPPKDASNHTGRAAPEVLPETTYDDDPASISREMCPPEVLPEETP